MPVPGKCHKCVAYNKQEDCQEYFFNDYYLKELCKGSRLINFCNVIFYNLANRQNQPLTKLVYMKKNLLIIALLFLIMNSANAQWDGNPATVDNPVTVTGTSASIIYSVSDGAGGVIVVWTATDDASNNYIYAQRKSSVGQVVWGDSTTLVQIVTSQDDLSLDDIVPDGAGGVYVTWDDPSDVNTSADVYMQHINGSGTALLTANGIKINAADGHDNYSAQLDVDAQGVIVTWTDELDDSVTDTTITAQVYAQRYNTSGIAQWGTGGVQVCTASGLRAASCIVSDGNNGALIGFEDTSSRSKFVRLADPVAIKFVVSVWTGDVHIRFCKS